MVCVSKIAMRSCTLYVLPVSMVTSTTIPKLDKRIFCNKNTEITY